MIMIIKKAMTNNTVYIVQDLHSCFDYLELYYKSFHFHQYFHYVYLYFHYIFTSTNLSTIFFRHLQFS